MNQLQFYYIYCIFPPSSRMFEISIARKGSVRGTEKLKNCFKAIGQSSKWLKLFELDTSAQSVFINLFMQGREMEDTMKVTAQFKS